MVSAVRKPRMKEVPLSEVKDDLSRFLREAKTQYVVITRHGKPAGVLIGFKSEDDWFDYRLEHDPRFLQRVEQARASIRAGRGVKFADIKWPCALTAQSTRTPSPPELVETPGQ